VLFRSECIWEIVREEWSVFIRFYAYVCINVYVYVCMCAYVYACVYVYV